MGLTILLLLVWAATFLVVKAPPADLHLLLVAALASAGIHLALRVRAHRARKA